MSIGNKIDQKNPTMVLVLSDKKCVFGGYTPIAWSRSGDQKKNDGSSFLFSVRNDNTIVKCEHIDRKYECFHSSDTLVSFGEGLWIF